MDIQKLKKLPIPILNEFNLNSKKLEQLPNNILQELSVEHLIKLPLEKLKQLDLTNKLTEYPIEIFKKTQELKGNIELSGNEGYLIINREFIKTDEFLSGFEFEKDSFQPIDAQYANEIQKIMYGNIQPQNLDTLEHNLSHSEQRMMLYILQKLEKGEGINEIVMFTGRKCCPVCHEALPKFMEHIKTNYSNLLPENLKITVYDFWNNDFNKEQQLYDDKYWKKEYNNSTYNNTNYYNVNDTVKYMNIFDRYSNIKHLSEFVAKINNGRTSGINNAIGNSQYTVESLKGDSNVPIVFSMEELEEYDSIKTPVEKIKTLIEQLKNNVDALNSSLKELDNNSKKIDIIRQALDMEKNQLPVHDDTKSQSQFFGEQSEKNTQNKTQLETATQIDETTQVLATKIKKLRDSLNEIKNQYIALKNDIIESKQFKEENISKQQEEFEKKYIFKETEQNVLAEKRKEIQNVINQINNLQKEEYNIIKNKQKQQEKQEKMKKLRKQYNELQQNYRNIEHTHLKNIKEQSEEFKNKLTRYKQNSVVLKTFQDRQMEQNFDLQDYLKKTFAIDGITATVHEA